MLYLKTTTMQILTKMLHEAEGDGANGSRNKSSSNVQVHFERKECSKFVGFKACEI